MPLDFRPAMQAAARPAPTDNLQQQLIKACRAGSAQQVQVSLAAGASVTAADGRGWTALHHAAFSGYLQVVDQLLAAGCAADAASLQGETPLSLAALGRREAVCLCLMKAGANIQAVADPSDRAYLQQIQGANVQLAVPVGRPTQQVPAAALPPPPPPVLLTAGALDSPIMMKRPSTAKQSRQLSIQSSKAIISHGTKSEWDAESVSSPPKKQVPGKPKPAAAARNTHKAWPMYVPAQYTQTHNDKNTKQQPTGRTRWELQALRDKSGRSSGLLLDPVTQLVYYRPVICCTDGAAEHVSDGDDVGDGGGIQVPVLVGVQLHAGQIDLPGVEHLQLLQQCQHALRSLKHNHPAARMLCDEARRAAKKVSRKGISLLADFRIALDTAPCCAAVSLAVPLCAVMGVQQLQELQQVTPRELRHVGVDEAFLQLLQLAARSAQGVGSTQTNTLQRSAADRCKEWLTQSAQTSGKWQPPAVAQLLAQHGLLKLVPLAVELGALSSRKISSWGCLLRTATQRLQLWGPELARLQSLKDSLKTLQEQCTMMQAGRMIKLSRISVGSLVLYESSSEEALLKGQRMVGIVLKAPGSHNAQVTLRSTYTIRDILTDRQESVTAGQVSHISNRAAQQYLRVDLLPPHSLGCPVTPLSAAPGLLVQLVPRWPASHSRSLVQAPVDQDAALCLPTVIGQLDCPVVECDQGSSNNEEQQLSAGSLSWYVRWPDGSRTQHAVGAAGRFELCHIHLHRLAGAPLLQSHFNNIKEGGQQLPVLRSPTCPHTSHDTAPAGGIGLLHVDRTEKQADSPKQPTDSSEQDLDGTEQQSPGEAADDPHMHNAGPERHVRVMWVKARDPHKAFHSYAADNKGLYCLDHALLAGQPLTALAAKPGVRVTPGPGAEKQVEDAAGAGPGTLLGPLRITEDGVGVVWEVSWPTGTITECVLQGWDHAALSHLCVSAIEMQLPGEGSVALNELQPSSTQATGGLAAAAALNATVAVAGSTLRRFTDTEKAARTADMGRIGRPLFTSHMQPRAGMLGTFVKLNREAAALQPYCLEGPLRAYTPRTPAEVLAAQQQGGPAAPLDDVGWVVRDTGAGQWRALLVRKLGSSHSFWYDEASLLPASQLDIIRQMKRMAGLGCAYLPPIKDQGVPVTSITAAPGMLVMRSFTVAEVHEGSDKADMVGQLVQPIGDHHWQVSWQDGTTGVYKTGAEGRFQLSHINVAEDAGAPLSAATLAHLQQDHEGMAMCLNVMPGQHSCRAALPAGTASQTDDIGQPPVKPDVSCLKWGEVAALSVKDVVSDLHTGLIHVGSPAAATPCTYVGGGPLGLYELAHAACACEPVTVYIAKPGLRVMRAADLEEAGVSIHGSSTAQHSSNVQVGILLRPTHLQLLAKLDSREPSGDPTQLLDPGLCWWDVQWGGEDGVVQQLPVGTLPEHTPLKVALGGPVRSATAITRAVAQLDRLLKTLQQTSRKLLYGGNGDDEPNLLGRLVAILALVQVDCMRAGQGDAMIELNAINDAAEVQSYDYTEYLQRVQQTMRAVGQLHSATVTLELSQQQLGPMQGAAAAEALQAMDEIASDAADYISSSLPLACSIIHKATLTLAFDSCAFVLHDKGSIAKVAHRLEHDGDEVLKDCTDKASKTSVSLNICCSKLQEMEGMVPEQAFYADALHDRVQQEHSMAALACAGAAAEWLACAAIPIHDLVTDENTSAADLIVNGDLISACLAEQQKAMLAWQKAMELVKPGTGCELKAAGDANEKPQQDAAWVMNDDSPKGSAKQSMDGSKEGEGAGDGDGKKEEDGDGPETRTGEMCLVHVRAAVGSIMQQTVDLLYKANVKLTQPQPLQPAVATPTAPLASVAPVSVTSPSAAAITVTPQPLDASAQVAEGTGTATEAASATVPAATLAGCPPPPAVPTPEQVSKAEIDVLKQALEVERGTRLMADHAGVLLQLLPACIPLGESQDAAAGLLQQIQGNASKAAQRVQQLASQQASRACKEECQAVTPASKLCVALSKLADDSGVPEVAEYWARRAASHWPDVVAGVRSAQRDVARGAELYAVAAARAARDAMRSAEDSVKKSADKQGAVTDKEAVLSACQVACQAAEAAAGKTSAAILACQATEAWQAAIAAAEAAVSAAGRSADEIADAREHLLKVKTEASKAESALEVLADWQAEQAHICTKGLVEGWASKVLDNINNTQELTEQDAMNWYQASVQARCAPATGPNNARTPMHSTDKTLVALTTQLEPLRMSLEPLSACAAKDRLGGGGLDDAYNSLFQAAIQAVVSRHTDFERDITTFKFMLEDVSEGRQSTTGDDDSPAKPLSSPAELVARAYGYVYVLKATFECAEALLKQVPMVLPKEDGVMNHFRDCKRKHMPGLLNQVRELEGMLLPDDRKSFAGLSAALFTPSSAASQVGFSRQVSADDPRLAAAGLHAIQVEVLQQDDDQEACFQLKAVPRRISQRAACDVVNAQLGYEQYTEQLEACVTYAKQLQAAAAKVQAVTGTSWSPTTLKLTSKMAALQQEWEQQVSAATVQLPQLLVQGQAAPQQSHSSHDDDDE